METKRYLGIDIGGTAVKMAVIDETGKILDNVGTYPVAFDNYETPILETVVKSAREQLNKAYALITGMEPNEALTDYSALISGIGVSATGAIDSRRGIVAGVPGIIRNWLGSDIAGRMTKEFNVPTHVLNDANAAALGEAWLGAAKGKQDVVVMTVGTGVGGGILVNGRILLGRKGYAGEIGHTPLKSDGGMCSCGNRGCIEYYGSMTALVGRVRKALTEGTVKGIESENVNGRTIFAAVRGGNKEIAKIVDEWMDDIASALVGFIHTFNPEQVLIGGGVSEEKELFTDKVREKVLKRIQPVFAEGLEIDACAIGNKAGMIGAVKFCMDEEAAKQ